MKLLLSILFMGLTIFKPIYAQTKKGNNSIAKTYSSYNAAINENRVNTPIQTMPTAKSDSIFTKDGLILANVKEVSLDGIKYTYPSEEVLNNLNKNQIYKICYRSGRVQLFNEETSLEVASGNDWQKVEVSEMESRIKNLQRLESVTVNLKGSNSKLNETKEKALQSLRKSAAFLGGNVVYLVDKGPLDNKGEVNYVGVAYANQAPNYQDFVKQIGKKTEFNIIKEQAYESGDSKLDEEKRHPKSMIFNEVRNDNGNIIIKSKSKGLDTDTFRVTYYDISKIVLMWRDKNKVHNFILTY